MSRLGLPVPPGFTITTDVCTYFYAHDNAYPPDLAVAVDDAVAVGMIESFASFWSGALKDVIVFSLLIPVLLVRSYMVAHHEEEVEEVDQ